MDRRCCAGALDEPDANQVAFARPEGCDLLVPDERLKSLSAAAPTRTGDLLITNLALK
jgi:hypothetical protein